MGKAYRAEKDKNAVVMFNQRQRDGHKASIFVPDCISRNAVTIRNYTLLLNIEAAMEFVAARQLRRKIDLTDGYPNIHMYSDAAKDTSFLCHVEHYRSHL